MAKRRKRSNGIDGASDSHNADYFAQKHDILLEQARKLMRRIGRDRDGPNDDAARLFRG
jgi:hypothetical protein